MSIELHIEELVLHGVARADRDVVVDALRQALLDRLAHWNTGDLAQKQIPRLDAGTLRLPADASPGALGEQIGLALSDVVPR